MYRTYAMRARLERNFGTAANQILWRGQAPLIGDPSYADEAVFAVDRWLARVHADHRRIPLARKIIQDRPDTVAPRCTDGSGKDAAVIGVRPGGHRPTARRAWARTARMSDDVMKCRLKPMRRDDYPVTFTDAQWQRLQGAFPGGVCDYTKPGVRASTARCRGSPTRRGAAA